MFYVLAGLHGLFVVGTPSAARAASTVQVGKRANLLLTRQDPTQSIEAYDNIVKVILGGRVLDRAELAAHR